MNISAININPNFYNNDYKNIQNINTKKIEDNKLKDVCNDFESFFMQQLLDISLKNTKVAGSGTGSDIVKGLYIDGISKGTGGSAGISSLIYDYLSAK
jgi:hypothetical protein